MNEFVIIAIVLQACLILVLLMLLVKCYHRCPSNKLMVIWGVGTGPEAAMVLHGGTKFVIPIVQDYAYLDLGPREVDIALRGVPSSNNNLVSVEGGAILTIGTEPDLRQNAASHLLQLCPEEIVHLASEIIHGQLRRVIGATNWAQIRQHRAQFVEDVECGVEPKLYALGLVVNDFSIANVVGENGQENGQS